VPRDTRRWLRLVGAANPAAGDRLLLSGLTVGSWGYRLLSGAARAYACARGRWIPSKPTLCVGNITVGGTGKTTFVRYLARLLLGRGLRPAIVMRGYGRSRRGLLVAHDGERPLADPAEAGDEAVMLGESLECVPVVVGARRIDAIQHATVDLGADVVLMDDGLQHWAVAPHSTLALWDATLAPSAARMFPRGTLREPTSALRRFDLVAVTRCDGPDAERVILEVRALVGADPVRAVHRATGLRTAGGQVVRPESLAGTNVYAASSLGNPYAFRRSLEGLGATVLGESVFPDHHAYSRADLAAVLGEAGRAGTECVVVTEKDLVKLRAFPESRELSALVVDVELVGPGNAQAVDRLLDLVLSRGRAT